ncbi:MAG: hydroxymethylbilane synthase [Actinomycetota bacterium]|jgi:hydroxymethylbilane synthase|nr:hydroxymethylbilane synthase [Actinomycetota bacterium]
MAHVGTRGSRLARAQTAWVIERLRDAVPDRRWLEVLISTAGDQSASLALGTGVFVKEIEQALLEGAIDVAVHSLKDLPTDPTPGLTIAAVPERADPRDSLVGGRLDDLPDGARVGTGSPRRGAQLRRLRPGLDVVPIRGNVPTRVDKVRTGQVEAVMVAAAGLGRLGIPADDFFDPEVILPAPGQGALAIQSREDDELASLVAALDHPPTRSATTAERAVLASLGGGCMLPIATYARHEGGVLVVEAAVTSDDGTRQVRARASGDPAAAEELGASVAERLADLGAMELLQESTGARGAPQGAE